MTEPLPPLVLPLGEALERLQALVGQDLVDIARAHGCGSHATGRLNKGWAGMAVEKHLGMKLNSVQAPDGGNWELKTTAARLKNGVWRPKETLAVTMINPQQVLETPFSRSHLRFKLEHLLLLVREYVGPLEPSSPVLKVVSFEMAADQELLAGIENDYEEVRAILRTRGFSALTGRMGVYCQPRTKGAGHGTISRAFYLRIPALERIIGPF